ncbi:hypothetical protein OROMI_002219 [Orobanche minor]
MEFLINPLDPVKQLRLLQAFLPGMGENTMAVYTDYKKSVYRKIGLESLGIWKSVPRPLGKVRGADTVDL